MDCKSATTVFPMEPQPRPPTIRRRGAEDLISGLPDEILHVILSRLKSASAAARTSVLSRRWRGVWAHMPELVLGGSPAPGMTPSAFLDSIDAALNSSAAPALLRLKIDVDVSESCRCDVPADRVASWLRFASQRLTGKVHLRVFLQNDAHVMPEFALPICERAKEIEIEFGFLTEFFLRPPPTGSFLALTNLKIRCQQIDGGDLGRMVSSVQCPCLRKLRICVLALEPICDISISSESLKYLYYWAAESGKLEVNAPMLKVIDVSNNAPEAFIAAPNLEIVKWLDPYDPSSHQFAMSGRHLRSLSIKHSTCYYFPRSSTQLMKRFDTVSELKISLSLGKGIAKYMTFLEEMDKLPICETLVVHLTTGRCGHNFAQMMLHLLRRSICIRKFKLVFDQSTPSEMPSCTTSDCPCHMPENYRLDDITFDSLEEIGISFFTGSAEQEEFMELLLSRCNTMTLKRVDFTAPFSPVSSEIMEVVQRVRNMCHPNSKVQFNVKCREVPKA